MQAHEQRVVDEKRALDEKTEKSARFIDGPIFQGLHPVDQGLLRDQENAMLKYSSILGLRIARFGA